MDRDEETLDYNLSLNAAAEETREGYTGYTDYDPDTIVSCLSMRGVV